MKRLKLAVGVVLAVVLLVVGTVLGIGALIPETHTASVSVELSASPGAVWEKIRDIEGSAAWRDGIQEVRRIPDREPESYEEISTTGPLRYAVVAEVSQRELVTVIVDNASFGGTWTYQLEEIPDGTRLRVTEDGEIHNLLFRFFARYVFGYEATMKGYVESLEAALEAPQ